MNQIINLFKYNLNEQIIKMNENSFDKGKIISLLKNLSLIFLSTWVIYAFDIEDDLNLPAIMTIVCVAFIINAFLPISYRLFFFFIISLVPIFYFFPLVQAFIFIGIALALIGICHLPFSITIRKLLVVLFGIGLAYCQYAIKKTGFVGGLALTSNFVS